MEILRKLRNEKGVFQKDVAAYLGVDRTTYVKYERGDSEPNLEIIKKLSEYFNVTVDYLLGKDSISKTKKGIKIPVLGNVAAGIPIEAIEDIVDYEEIDEEMASKGEYFALRIKGVSMEPKISEGDVVIVKKQSYVDNGQLAIVMVNGSDATCKKVICAEKGIKLISFNPAYEPMFYTCEEIESLPITILGRVVECRCKF